MDERQLAQLKELDKPFEVKDISWIINGTFETEDKKVKGYVSPFVDARAIENRLDQVIGRDNWQNRITSYPGNANSLTSYICDIYIYDIERKIWITKSNGAGDTDYEQVKGGLSDAFKRAASRWGIGRYLYSFNKNTVANIVVKGKNKKIDPREYKRLNQIYAETFPGAKPFQSDAQQTAPSSKNLIYTVEKAVSNGKQSQVVLKSANGEQLRGYVVGIPCPKTNQRIIDLKTVKRKDEKLGEYIIIQGYKAA